MKPSTFAFLTKRGVRNLGKHWAMTIACIASLSVCMTLNIFATLVEVNVDSMVNYLGQQNEMVVYVDPNADDATIQSVGEKIAATPGVSRMQYMSKEDVLNQYRGYMADYAVLLDEFETDNPFKANYRVSLGDLSQMSAMSQTFQQIPGVYSVAAPIEMTNTFVQVQQAVTQMGRGIVLVLMIGQVVFSGIMFTLTGVAARIAAVVVCRWGMGALGASTDLNSRLAWLKQGFDSPMYDATVANLMHSWQMMGLITVVCLTAAWLVLQISFNRRKA